jgi:ADP-ribose pyrophosphatase YjhB (NUDIX family)
MDDCVIASGPVIIKKEDNQQKVLLCRHGDDTGWKFPGGKVEKEDFTKGENVFRQTCLRESSEELGAPIEIIHALEPMLLLKNNQPVILIHYLARLEGEINPPKEIETGWFDINNLPECMPNVYQVLKEFK